MMIARTPFDAPTLTSLDELDLASLPPGTTEVYTLNGTTFYRVEWLLAVRAGAVSYVGEADSASAQLERLAAIERQLLDLHAEHEGLIACLMPPAAPAAAKPAPAPKHATPAPTPKAMVRCAVDGCDVEKGYGTAIAMHRQRMHRDWFVRQMALPDEHPLKAERTGAIVLVEAAQTDQLPPIKELPVVPEVSIAPEVAPIVPFDQSPA